MGFSVGNRERFLGWLVALVVVATASIGGASAYTLKPLYDFCAQQNCADGETPNGPLLMDPSGNIFGVTNYGGTGHGPNGTGGTVFELRHDSNGRWTERVLHSFCLETNCTDGVTPSGALIQDVAGNLYGTAIGESDGCSPPNFYSCGIVFELIPNAKRTKWKFRIAYEFCHKVPDCRDGALPRSALYYAGGASGAPYDGVSPLYVLPSLVGGVQNAGAVLELTPGKPRWHGSVIHDFCSGGSCNDFYPGPAWQLFVDASGDVYGATGDRIFELTPSAGRKHWTTTKLRSFCAPYFDNKSCLTGAFPAPPSVRGADGSFYGTTFKGGKYLWPPDFTCSDFNPSGGCGVLYKLVQDGEHTREKVLYDFCSESNCADGAFPDPHLSMDSSGSLFGTTIDGGDESQCGQFSGWECPGVVFQFGNDGYHMLYSFCSEANCTDGARPSGGVTVDAAGNLFGAAGAGGQHKAGRIYELVP
jgi:hypothetical protein